MLSKEGCFANGRILKSQKSYQTAKRQQSKRKIERIRIIHFIYQAPNSLPLWIHGKPSFQVHTWVRPHTLRNSLTIARRPSHKDYSFSYQGCNVLTGPWCFHRVVVDKTAIEQGRLQGAVPGTIVASAMLASGTSTGPHSNTVVLRLIFEGSNEVALSCH